MLAAPMFATQPAANEEVADTTTFVPGRFVSLAAAPDGSVYLLARDQRVVKIDQDGRQTEIALPQINGKPVEFSDMVVRDGQLLFCGFPYADIYALDLRKSSVYKVIKTGSDAKNLLNLAVKGYGLCVRDADYNLFSLVEGKPATRLDKNAELESDAEGRTVVIPSPAQMGDKILSAGRVMKDDGRLFWVAPAPESPKQIMSIDFLGTDAADRYIFRVVAASGELDTEYTLHAVVRGRSVASMQIPGPEGLEMQHYFRLAPDGSILLVQADSLGREGIRLKRLQLKDGEFIAAPAAQG